MGYDTSPMCESVFVQWEIYGCSSLFYFSDRNYVRNASASASAVANEQEMRLTTSLSTAAMPQTRVVGEEQCSALSVSLPQTEHLYFA